MTYKILRSEDDAYDILENTTDQVICLETTQENAIRILANLNKGGGFNGRTPPFLATDWAEEA